MDRPAQDAELLLAHSAWVRRLARSLVADSHSADDLVQRTWVAALERPPGEHVPLRSWFAAVLRNLARQDRRASGRRALRERAAARSDILPPADESLEGIARQQMLMQAVLELDEPYRTVVVRRYYDGLPPREIARELRVPVKTVKTRLARALEKLRERLDREHGFDRGAWVALFVPWIHAHGSVAVGGLLMNAKIKAAIGVALVAGTIAAVVHWTSPESTSPKTAPEMSASAAVLETPELPGVVELAESSERQVERAPASVPAPTPAKPDIATPAEPRIHGRVIDTTGRAIADIDVLDLEFGFRQAAAHGKRALARTDANGMFELDYPRQPVSLVAESPSWTTALSPGLNGSERERRAVIVVAPKLTLAGRVLDEARRPVEGAKVSSSVDDMVRASVGEILDSSITMAREVETNAQGQFELANVPGCPGRITAQVTGYELIGIPIPTQSTTDIEIVLRKPEKPHIIVRGIVLEPGGRPADAALVSHGAAIERTGPDGRFEFDFALALGGGEYAMGENGVLVEKYAKLHAVKAGFGPASEDLPSLASLRASGEPTEVTLVLGAHPLSIHGRVVDARGAALPRALVWLKDGTPFGNFVEKTGDATIATAATVEGALREEHDSGELIADGDGRFVLDGVLDREYTLLARDSKTMRYGRRAHVRGGEEKVELVIADEPPCERVAGRVVSRSGRRIAGAMVFAGRKSDPETPVNWMRDCTTDSEGRFDFGEIAAEGLHFQITGPEIALVFDYPLPPDSKLSDLELPASLQCHVQVDLGERATFADQFAVLDDKGVEITMLCWRGSMCTVGTRYAINAGRSEVVLADEAGREAVLYKDNKEVVRLPLAFKPGEVTTVRP